MRKLLHETCLKFYRNEIRHGFEKSRFYTRNKGLIFWQKTIQSWANLEGTETHLGHMSIYINYINLWVWLQFSCQLVFRWQSPLCHRLDFFTFAKTLSKIVSLQSCSTEYYVSTKLSLIYTKRMITYNTTIEFIPTIFSYTFRLL